MKVFLLTKKKIILIISVFTFFLVLSKMTNSFGMEYYYNVDFTTGIVTASILNVRCGPGTQYKVIATVKKKRQKATVVEDNKSVKERSK